MFVGRVFSYLDSIRFLNIHVWEFSGHSFFKEYAHLFFVKAMLRYPGKTLRGLSRYHRFIRGQSRYIDLRAQYSESLFIPDKSRFIRAAKKQERTLVGLGFCLKPSIARNRAASCPVGRPNHECLYLQTGRLPAVCENCAIHSIAKKCLCAGWPVYIMTSAEDIARDFLLPQIQESRFPSAVLFLCPYSVQAILPALFICGVNAFLVAYDAGFCRDYEEWRLADLGFKDEMTVLSAGAKDNLNRLLEQSPRPESRFQQFRREGNIFYPG